MDNNDLLSLPEVAGRLRMRPGAIYAARRRGAFPPAARIGGKLMWRRGDIEAHIGLADKKGVQKSDSAAPPLRNWGLNML